MDRLNERVEVAPGVTKRLGDCTPAELKALGVARLPSPQTMMRVLDLAMVVAMDPESQAAVRAFAAYLDDLHIGDVLSLGEHRTATAWVAEEFRLAGTVDPPDGGSGPGAA